MKRSAAASLPLVILLGTALSAQTPGSRPAPASSTPRVSSPTQPATPDRTQPTATPAPTTSTPPAAPALPATSTPRPAAAATADYRIVPGDKLNIQVYKDNQLSQQLQVRPDGKITLPLVGDVRAEGRTSAELRDSLVESLKEYNNNPVVTVIVTETVPPVFYVMGEVNAPGTLPLKGQISMVQALAMAGGFKDFAKKKDIIIQRKGATGVTAIPFNYNDAIKGRGSMVYVQPGDTIIVP
jgi:polysaccharide export outer membrane protein